MLFIVSFAALLKWPAAALSVAAACLVGIVLLNLDFYRFFVRVRGVWFAARVLPMHILYYFYSGATFATLSLLHRLGAGGGRAGRRDAFAAGIVASGESKRTP